MRQAIILCLAGQNPAQFFIGGEPSRPAGRAFSAWAVSGLGGREQNVGITYVGRCTVYCLFLVALMPFSVGQRNNRRKLLPFLTPIQFYSRKFQATRNNLYSKMLRYLYDGLLPLAQRLLCSTAT